MVDNRTDRKTKAGCPGDKCNSTLENFSKDRQSGDWPIVSSISSGPSFMNGSHGSMFPVRWDCTFGERRVSGFARATALSLRRRAGMLSRPVDLDVLIFFNSLHTYSSSTLDNLKTLRVSSDRAVVVGCKSKFYLIFMMAVRK